MFKTIAPILVAGFVVYVIEKILFSVLNIDTSTFQLSLEKTHILMLLLSILVTIVLNLVFKKNKELVGMTFLLITSVKVAIIYFIGSHFIMEVDGSSTEKWNFYGLFIFYLFLETFHTAKKLNQTSFS
ncbi:hypothetical protein [Flavobacterium luminosum]|uniref:Uncharacterized protein n=1 Tax=Flavobacterium luminosum TaxID=2949086 RepID=A0ABT0TR01_9FLAO|nr:hypothetical protein [Flavobacterium sp. HXWNR70]MCL9809913.1 hypothetical protein [Flavobacterium sp. HXWNR70]